MCVVSVSMRVWVMVLWLGLVFDFVLGHFVWLDLVLNFVLETFLWLGLVLNSVLDPSCDLVG